MSTSGTDQESSSSNLTPLDSEELEDEGYITRIPGCLSYFHSHYITDMVNPMQARL